MRHLLTIGAALLVLALGSPAFSQANNASPAISAPATADPPPKVRELLDLMGDPQVRAWLDQRKVPLEGKAQAASRDAGPPSTHTVELDALVGRLGRIRSHVASLVAALPHVGEDFHNAGKMLASELQGRELWRMLRLFVLFIGLLCILVFLVRASHHSHSHDTRFERTYGVTNGQLYEIKDR